MATGNFSAGECLPRPILFSKNLHIPIPVPHHERGFLPRYLNPVGNIDPTGIFLSNITNITQGILTHTRSLTPIPWEI
jgi:hypothetical protein